MRFNAALARRVALILGLSFPTFCNALADGRAVLPPRWMVDAYLSDALVKPSRDDIARAILPGLGMVPAFMGGTNYGPPPTFVSASTVSNGDVAQMPSGWAVGDLLIIFADSFKSGATVDGYNTPSGWNDLGSCLSDYSPSGGYAVKMNTFWRVAQAGDTTVNLTKPSGNNGYKAFMTAYRNADIVSPFEGISSLDKQSNSASCPYIQITTLGGNRVVVQALLSGNSASGGASPGVGWTERVDTNSALGIVVDDKVFEASGQTPAGVQTQNTASAWGRVAFAIKPAQV